MKASADRILYLARVVLKSLKDNRNLEQKADDETVRRAVVRELTDSFKELDAIEEKVRASLAKREGDHRKGPRVPLLEVARGGAPQARRLESNSRS